MESINFNVILHKVSYILHKYTLTHFLFQNRLYIYIWDYKYNQVVNIMRLVLRLRSWRMRYDIYHKQEFLSSPLCLVMLQILPRIMTILFLAIREVYCWVIERAELYLYISPCSLIAWNIVPRSLICLCKELIVCYCKTLVHLLLWFKMRTCVSSKCGQKGREGQGNHLSNSERTSRRHINLITWLLCTTKAKFRLHVNPELSVLRFPWLWQSIVNTTDFL
jgi:hypothetical protein